MENIVYTSIGPVLHLNKAGELAQKHMKAAKLCDGLYITEPDKTQFVKLIVEYNGVKWVEHQAPAANVNPVNMAKRMPAILASIEGGRLNELTDYHKELHRRIFNPDAPAIMELRKLERKKTAPLPEGAKKVSVIMFKGCTDEMTDKKVIINEVAPHVYTYTYKLKHYGERVKIIFEIDGIYFQGADNGAYVMAREDFDEACTKAYEHARENVADGAAKGMRYFVEVQKRIDAATSPEVAQTVNTDAAITLPTEDINYMFYIKPKGAKRFSTYNPGKGTMNTGRVFTELYRKEHLPAVCKWIAEDKSGDFAYQLRSGDGKRIYWQRNPTAATPSETPQNSTETAENMSAENEKVTEMAKYRISRFGGYKIIIGDREQGKVIAVLMSVNGHNTIEISDDSAGIATMREVSLQIGKPIMQLSDAEVLKLIYSSTEPPQPSETPQTVKRAGKPRETARKEQKRTISKMERVHARQKLGVQGYSMFADASATLAAINAPPIRGDCKIGVFQRAKPPNSTLYKKISILQPP